jgi:PKD repeat protein
MHRFEKIGVYSVTLTVDNEFKKPNSRLLSNLITVDAPPPPIAIFDAQPVRGQGPLVVTFTDHSTGDPVSWTWNFGDGESSSNPSTSHVYNMDGSYTASLTVRNAYDAADVHSITIDVYPTPTPPPPPPQPEPMPTPPSPPIRMDVKLVGSLSLFDDFDFCCEDTVNRLVPIDQTFWLDEAQPAQDFEFCESAGDDVSLRFTMHLELQSAGEYIATSGIATFFEDSGCGGASHSRSFNFSLMPNSTTPPQSRNFLQR